MKSKKKRGFFSRIIRFFLLTHLAFLLIVLLGCGLMWLTDPPITPWMIWRWVAYGWVPQQTSLSHEEIPKAIRVMVVQLEDDTFYQNWGFDFDAMQKAWHKNKRAQKIRRGGSTISQQAARIMFLTLHRNYFRKYLEMWVTAEMELVLSKRRILDLYLNYVEFGKGVYGIEAASQYYWNKPARKLTLTQQKQLAALLASPIKHHPRNAASRFPARYRHLNRFSYPRH